MCIRDSVYGEPYEPREMAAERYLEEKGISDPAEIQRFLDALPDYGTFDLQEERQRYSKDLLGDWTPKQE